MADNTIIVLWGYHGWLLIVLIVIIMMVFLFGFQIIADKKPEVVERLYAKYIGDHLFEDCIK